MKHKYSTWSKYAAFVLAAGLSSPAAAQYVFTDANLTPYQQDFNTLNDSIRYRYGTTTRPELLGLYAEAEADPMYGSGSISPATVKANDGSTLSGNYYHFGQTGDTDRAFGGIAQTGFYTGRGYVGIRLKNNSTGIIENLDVLYAMEQWYNSGNASAAFVNVSYRKSGSGVAGENMASMHSAAVGNSWTAVPELTVAAPSTGTAIQSRDGNSAANRRVVQHTLPSINIEPGQEIMLRWDYVLNPTTNGNGVSIDDVVITPQTAVFFAAGGPMTTDLRAQPRRTLAGVQPSNVGTVMVLDWRSTAGVSPTSLSEPNQTFYVKGAVNAADLTAITGENSRIVIGVPAQNGHPAAAGELTLSDNTVLTVPIDLLPGSRLRIEEAAAGVALPVGTLDPTSTVVYAGSAAAHTIQALSYGNLTLEGAGAKTLAGPVLINGNLKLTDAKLQLGAFDATITKGGRVEGNGAAAYVVTDQQGRLRQSVLGNGQEVLFPVGTPTSYNPVRLKQGTARSEDVFSVRVTGDKYATYGPSDAGQGSPILQRESVRQTWLVSEEVSGNSNLSLQLQWKQADQSADFTPAQAYVSHFHNGYWDRVAGNDGALLVPSTTDTYIVSRTGITSFSPFTVSTDSRPLPVVLAAFQARRTGATVTCIWETASELNNAYFVLERSLSGHTFEVLDTVRGAGTTSARRTYTSLDRRPSAQMAYYRLRQVDNDGTQNYSSVVAVQGRQVNLTATASPNPSSGEIMLTIPAAEAGTLLGTVTNVLGKQVLHFTRELPAGQHNIPLTLSGQPAGLYFLRLQTPQGQQTIRLLKK